MQRQTFFFPFSKFKFTQVSHVTLLWWLISASSRDQILDFLAWNRSKNKISRFLLVWSILVSDDQHIQDVKDRIITLEGNKISHLYLFISNPHFLKLSHSLKQRR